MVIHVDTCCPGCQAVIVYGLHPLELFKWARFAALCLSLVIYVILPPYSRRVFGEYAMEIMGLLALRSVPCLPRLTRGRIHFWRGRHPLVHAARAKREGPPKRALVTMRGKEENDFYGSSC